MAASSTIHISRPPPNNVPDGACSGQPAMEWERLQLSCGSPSEPGPKVSRTPTAVRRSKRAAATSQTPPQVQAETARKHQDLYPGAAAADHVKTKSSTTNKEQP